MKVFTSINMTDTSSLRLEASQHYVLEKINQFLIFPLIKFCKFCVYYGNFITHANYLE